MEWVPESLTDPMSTRWEVSRDSTGPAVTKFGWGQKGGALFQRMSVSPETEEMREWSCHMHTCRERVQTAGGISNQKLNSMTPRSSSLNFYKCEKCNFIVSVALTVVFWAMWLKQKRSLSRDNVSENSHYHKKQCHTNTNTSYNTSQVPILTLEDMNDYIKEQNEYKDVNLCNYKKTSFFSNNSIIKLIQGLTNTIKPFWFCLFVWGRILRSPG